MEIFIKPAPVDYQPLFLDYISIFWEQEIKLVFDSKKMSSSYRFTRQNAVYLAHQTVSKRIGEMQKHMRQDYPDVKYNPVGCFYLDEYKTECLLWTTGIVSREYAMSFMVERRVDSRFYRIYDI